MMSTTINNISASGSRTQSANPPIQTSSDGCMAGAKYLQVPTSSNPKPTNQVITPGLVRGYITVGTTIEATTSGLNSGKATAVHNSPLTRHSSIDMISGSNTCDQLSDINKLFLIETAEDGIHMVSSDSVGKRSAVSKQGVTSGSEEAKPNKIPREGDEKRWKGNYKRSLKYLRQLSLRDPASLTGREKCLRRKHEFHVRSHESKKSATVVQVETTIGQSIAKQTSSKIEPYSHSDAVIKEPAIAGGSGTEKMFHVSRNARSAIDEATQKTDKLNGNKDNYKRLTGAARRSIKLLMLRGLTRDEARAKVLDPIEKQKRADLKRQKYTERTAPKASSQKRQSIAATKDRPMARTQQRSQPKSQYKPSFKDARIAPKIAVLAKDLQKDDNLLVEIKQYSKKSALVHSSNKEGINNTEQAINFNWRDNETVNRNNPIQKSRYIDQREFHEFEYPSNQASKSQAQSLMKRFSDNQTMTLPNYNAYTSESNVTKGRHETLYSINDCPINQYSQIYDEALSNIRETAPYNNRAIPMNSIVGNDEKISNFNWQDNETYKHNNPAHASMLQALSKNQIPQLAQSDTCQATEFGHLIWYKNPSINSSNPTKAFLNEYSKKFHYQASELPNNQVNSFGSTEVRNLGRHDHQIDHSSDPTATSRLKYLAKKFSKRISPDRNYFHATESPNKQFNTLESVNCYSMEDGILGWQDNQTFNSNYPPNSQYSTVQRLYEPINFSWEESHKRGSGKQTNSKHDIIVLSDDEDDEEVVEPPPPPSWNSPSINLAECPDQANANSRKSQYLRKLSFLRKEANKTLSPREKKMYEHFVMQYEKYNHISDYSNTKSSSSLKEVPKAYEYSSSTTTASTGRINTENLRRDQEQYERYSHTRD